MITISLTSDLRSLTTLVKLQGLLSEITKELASTLIAEIRTRIHGEGKKADGSQIGSYQEDYLPVRKRFGRGGDTKVILSLTSGLENSYGIVQDEKGLYAVAILNDKYGEIVGYLEEKYGEIFALTAEEKELVFKILNNRINQLLEAA